MPWWGWALIGGGVVFVLMVAFIGTKIVQAINWFIKQFDQ